MFLKTLIYPYRILESGCFKLMDTECQLRVPEAKTARYETNFSLCIICQVDTPEPLVENPSAHEKLFTYISDCATYRDGKYPDIQRCLEYFHIMIFKQNVLHGTENVTKIQCTEDTATEPKNDMNG